MRFVAALSLAVLGGCTFAANDPGASALPPVERRLPGVLESPEMRDPRFDSASAGASLPELPGALPGERAPLLRYPYLEQRQYPGPRPYWETQPLFVAPLP